MGVLAPAFPAPNPSNIKSIRFYETGVATANFTDSKWPFERVDPADPAVPEQGWSYSIEVRAVGGDLQISFDGTNVHGFVLAGTTKQYEKRHEGGISVRGIGVTYHVEAW
jgi:hypothetical protein